MELLTESKTPKELIKTFNENVNKHLKPSWCLETNSYGAVFDCGFDDMIIKNTVKSFKKQINYIRSYENGKGEKPKYIEVTPKNFEKWFNTDTFTFDELAAGMIALRKELVSVKTALSNAKTAATNAIQSIIRDGDNTKDFVIDFFSNGSFGTKYTTADDEFIFDRLRKDSKDNLYILLKDNELFRIEFKPNTERTLLGNTVDVNTQFWPAFFKTFNKQFEEWNKTIKDTVTNFNFDEKRSSIEEELLYAGVPRLYLECHKLNLTMKEVISYGDNGTQKSDWFFDNCDLVLNGAGMKNYCYANKIRVFSENLLQPVDIGRVKTIPQYSNDENEIAIKHITHPSVKYIGKEMPKLPKTWQMFLGGDRFYDKLMDRMKIAHFIDNILTANYSGRQILVLGGEGSDGKGVFLEVLAGIIGQDHTAALNNSAFTMENEFGMENAVNKKFIYLSDCKSVSKLFSEDKFKALTGGDTVPINRKNMKMTNWKPQGLCVAIATNNNFFVNSEHGRSRAMPIVFRKNFKQNDMIARHEMIQRLLSEKDEFIQWCIDYKYWLNHTVCKDRLMHGEELVICTDEDLQKLMKGEEMDDFEMFKNFCEKQQLNGQRFCNWNDRTEAEDEDIENISDMFEEIIQNEIKYNSSSDEYEFSDSNEIHTFGPIIDNTERFIKPIDLFNAFSIIVFRNTAYKSLWESCGLYKKDFNPHSKIMRTWMADKRKVKLKNINNVLYKTLCYESDIFKKKDEKKSESLFDD